MYIIFIFFFILFNSFILRLELGVGQGIIYPATSLALNTYFRKKRNIAMGLCVTLTGLGPILMPLLIVKLLDAYATTGTLLIFAGIAANSLVGACLLRPFVNTDKIKTKVIQSLRVHFTIYIVFIYLSAIKLTVEHYYYYYLYNNI